MSLGPAELAIIVAISMLICMGPLIMIALAVYHVIRDNKRDESQVQE
jgi:hypothetical protein